MSIDGRTDGGLTGGSSMASSSSVPISMLLWTRDRLWKGSISVSFGSSPYSARRGP